MAIVSVTAVEVRTFLWLNLSKNSQSINDQSMNKTYQCFYLLGNCFLGSTRRSDQGYYVSHSTKFSFVRDQFTRSDITGSKFRISQ